MAEVSNKCTKTLKKMEKEPWVNVEEDYGREDSWRHFVEPIYPDYEELIEISSEEEKRKREEKEKKKRKKNKSPNGKKFLNTEIEFRSDETTGLVYKIDLTENVLLVLILNLIFLAYFFIYGVMSFMKISYFNLDSKTEHNGEEMSVVYKIDLTNGVLLGLMLNILCFSYFFIYGVASFVKKNCVFD